MILSRAGARTRPERELPPRGWKEAMAVESERRMHGEEEEGRDRSQGSTSS